MRRLLLSIATLFLLNACAVFNTIDFEVLAPSEITIPTDVKTIAFVYRNTRSHADTAYSNKNKTGKYEDEMFKNLIDICYEGFTDVVLPTEKFDSVYFYTMEREIINDRSNIPPLSWDTVNSICSRLGADVLVVLENSSFVVSKEYQGSFDNPDIRNNIAWDFKITTYDPFYPKVIDHKTYKDSFTFSNLVNYNEFSDPVDYELKRLSYSIGELYGMRINPYWRNISRHIYGSGNKTLTAGYYYFNEKKFKTAILVWKKLINNEKPKLAAKACINISSANEMLGNLEEAKKYASLSLFYYNKYKASDAELKYVRNLIRELQKRLIEVKILEKQI